MTVGRVLLFAIAVLFAVTANEADSLAVSPRRRESHSDEATGTTPTTTTTSSTSPPAPPLPSTIQACGADTGLKCPDGQVCIVPAETPEWPGQCIPFPTSAIQTAPILAGPVSTNPTLIIPPEPLCGGPGGAVFCPEGQVCIVQPGVNNNGWGQCFIEQTNRNDFMVAGEEPWHGMG